MYNRLLKTFIAVADAESFTKASDTLYLSPTAIMKQINSLENQLDLKLIDRAPTGIQLTKAGKIIYENAKFIIDYSEKAIRSAREAAIDKSFRVGTSILNPAKPFIDLFYRISGDFSDYILNIIAEG